MNTTVPRKVLVIEDDDDALELIASVLRHRGHTVVEAHDGAHALQQVGDVDLDVILLDLYLPDMSGTDFLEMRERVPRLASVPVVLMSGAENAGSLAESRRVSLLRKPFGAKDLYRVVELGGDR